MRDETVETAVSSAPDASEYAPYYEGYVSLVRGGDVIETLRRQAQEIRLLPADFYEDRAGVGYAPGKWSVKEVVGHMTDAERVFAYRAMCVARGDRTPLPGFDQDEYMRGANFNRRTLADLAAEFESVRAATISLFESFGGEEWGRRGTANNTEVSVRALAFITAGHAAHHFRVLRERYV